MYCRKRTESCSNASWVENRAELCYQCQAMKAGLPLGDVPSTRRRAATPPESPATGALDRQLCQVGGLNQNYTSRLGDALPHPDRGPRARCSTACSRREVRRVNVIVYANYGEPNARIVHGRDHDFPDVRSHEHNRLVEQQIQELAAEARAIIEETEQRQVRRIKALIREYYHTKNERPKREFEEANALFPFLFSRAWSELQARTRARPAARRESRCRRAGLAPPSRADRPWTSVYPARRRAARAGARDRAHDRSS